MTTVNVLCRNPNDDRVIPRFSRYLKDQNGWTLTAKPASAQVVYLSGYFEAQIAKPWPSVPATAYFTHREEEGSAKADLFDEIAGRVQLRIATAKMYADYLEQFGPTVQIKPPVERDRFTIPIGGRRLGRLVAGFSGFTYRSGRKGADLASAAVSSNPGKQLEWKASGRGWPVGKRNLKRYAWDEMPSFFQSLDILVVTSLIEGVPMPPLEALSCGVSLVIPREVGLLDELPDVLGIHRYERGNSRSLIGALAAAVETRQEVDREALREVTAAYTIDNWCEQHQEAIGALVDGPDAGMEQEEVKVIKPVKVDHPRPEPKHRGTSGQRGIYCVAFGDPARACAQRMMETAKQHMPEIPIALCSDRKIGPEDVLIDDVPDSDIGGRRAKLRAYELSPAEWESVLYLDADTEVISPDARFFFQLIEDGWEFVICKDPHLMDTMHSFRRNTNLQELQETAEKIHTMHTLQYNGGVWAFARNDRVKRFFDRWLAEWEVHAQRDQGALIRAMYTEPLKVYLLGNEWNHFKKYTKGIEAVAVEHHPGRARRWKGRIPGRIDSDVAWKAVERFKNG
jgi:hypothetical protein